jgi:cytidylate kinase
VDNATNRSVFVYGPAGCGKTTHAVALAKHFGLSKIADPIDAANQPSQKGWDLDWLYLSNARPTWAPEDDRRVIEFYDAMALARAGAE